MSGTPLSYFAENVPNNHTDLVLDIAKRNGHNITNKLQLIDYLRDVTTEAIFENGPQIPPTERTLDVAWAPTLEGNLGTLKKFGC